MRKSALLKAKAVGVHRAKTHKEDVLSICGPRRQSGMPSIYAPVLYTVGFLELCILPFKHTSKNLILNKKVHSKVHLLSNSSAQGPL